MLIGEVAERSGISARMLRHYDSVGLVSPSGRTHGGYRQYAEDDLRRLFHVEALRSLGLSLQEVAEALDDLAFDPAAVVDDLLARARERLAQQQELLDRLEQVRASSAAAWSDVLRLVGLLRGLDSTSPSARQRAVLSLAADGDATTLASAVLDEPDPVVGGALGWALARTGDDAVPMLAEALRSPVTDRRHRALAALTAIGSARATEALAAAVDHPDPMVRSRAVLAAGARGDLAVVTALVGLVVEGRDDVEAAEVLGSVASARGRAAEVVRAVTAALADAPQQARRRLTAALAEVPGPAARSTLAGLTGDPDRGVALTAQAVLRVRPPEP